jgi:hypothetical protein
MAIISLRLHGIPLLGDPAALVHNHIASYYAGKPILFEELTYDLNQGIHEYDRAIAKLASRVNE